ncbi:hypothetical protein FOL46_004411 [Perkinsus olseni]|uniref:Uncharacterized protein n=1 Tax=Perkinsus olseni TaxID=32597 RepID=A0A7J6MSQ3_PEROL|nr:hypothetical protein FOL46_004411 [Perkinsus olseni]
MEGPIDPECHIALLSAGYDEASGRQETAIQDDTASSEHEHPLGPIPEALHVYDEEGERLFPRTIPSDPDQPVFLRSALNRLLRMSVPDRPLMDDELPSARNDPRTEPADDRSRPDEIEPQGQGIEEIVRGSRAFEAIDTCWAEFIRQYQSQCEAQSSSEARQLMASNLDFITELRSRVRESWTMVAEASLPIDGKPGACP